MALVKDITFDRSGVTLGFHVVKNVSVSANQMNILVASYVSEDAAKARKNSVEVTSESVSYDGKAISPDLITYAQAQLLKLAKYAGATVA